MIKTLADQYLAQNAGRRYPFKDDTELPGWLPDSGVLDFRCTVQGVPAGTAVEARLVKAEHTADRQALFTVALTAGGVLLDEMVFGVPENAANGAPYTAYASGSRSHGALTVTSAAVPSGSAAGLPYDAEIEFLESTGTQWIDTGVSPNSDCNIFLDWARLTDESYQGIFGSRVSATATSAFAVFDYLNGIRSDFGGVGLVIQLYSAVRHTLMADSTAKKVTIDNASQYNYANTFTGNDLHMYLFSFNNNGATYTPSVMRLYAFKVWNNGTLTRDLIPVRFTNELGQAEGAMYDRVSGALHRNQGTGEFVRGDDLPATVYTLDIPFAATTIVCDSLKVRSIQSAHDLADARDDDDPAGLDATAAVSGIVLLDEGRNAEPYLDGNRLRLDIFKGAGLGERCQSAVSGGQRCGTVLFTINGERPGSDGDIRIVGDGGITVVPDPENHAVEIRMDDEAASLMADGCAPACPTYTTNTTVETNDTEEAE